MRPILPSLAVLIVYTCVGLGKCTPRQTNILVQCVYLDLAEDLATQLIETILDLAEVLCTLPDLTNLVSLMSLLLPLSHTHALMALAAWSVTCWKLCGCVPCCSFAEHAFLVCRLLCWNETIPSCSIAGYPRIFCRCPAAHALRNC